MRNIEKVNLYIVFSFKCSVHEKFSLNFIVFYEKVDFSFRRFISESRLFNNLADNNYINSIFDFIYLFIRLLLAFAYPTRRDNAMLYSSYQTTTKHSQMITRTP
jgi:hypothetical protein